MTECEPGEWKILHCFADEGVESECLSAYGDVIRVGLDSRDSNESQPIRADAKQLPIKDDVKFDLGLFHPPCQKWAKMTHIHGDRSEHPNLIPLARQIAEEYCDHYIIENVPRAPLHNPVILNGRMFGLPLKYGRAFETDYHVEQPPRERLLVENALLKEHENGGGWNGSAQLWQSVKGYSQDYNATSLKREAIPRAYINYLVRPLL